MNKEQSVKLIQYILLIVLGILFSISIIDENILIYCVGSALLVYGLFLLIKTFYLTFSLIKFDALAGASLIAIGSATLAKFLDLVNFVVLASSVVIAALGAALIIDSIVRIIKHKKNKFIIEIILGLVLLALGLMLCLWKEFQTYIWIVIGILLIIYGIFALVILFVKTNNKKVKKENK